MQTIGLTIAQREKNIAHINLEKSGKPTSIIKRDVTRVFLHLCICDPRNAEVISYVLLCITLFLSRFD